LGKLSLWVVIILALGLDMGCSNLKLSLTSPLFTVVVRDVDDF